MSWLFLIATLVAVGAYTHATLAAREALIAAARRSCAELRVQLLDDTVALSGLRLARDAHGRLRFARSYTFEVSVSGSDRHSGSALLIGLDIEYLRVELPDGAVLMPPRRATVHTLH